jgi:hypothetical protein
MSVKAGIQGTNKLTSPPPYPSPLRGGGWGGGITYLMPLY